MNKILAAVEEDRVLLVPLSRLSQALEAQSPHLLGILAFSDEPASYSPADTFPLADFAPYAPGSYMWNNGTGLLQRELGVPVFLLQGDMLADALAMASKNIDQVG